MTFAGEDAVMLGVFAVKIVIPKTYQYWRSFAELFKPASETFKIRCILNAVERVDNVAGYDNIIWLLLVGLFGNSAERGGFDLVAKMNIAN